MRPLPAGVRFPPGAMALPDVEQRRNWRDGGQGGLGRLPTTTTIPDRGLIPGGGGRAGMESHTTIGVGMVTAIREDMATVG